MFGEKHYGKEIDMWSLGCTLAELVLHEPLFQGQTDISQLEKIFTIIGYPVNTRALLRKTYGPRPRIDIPTICSSSPSPSSD